MDARDEITWLVLELTSQGEILAEEGALEANLRRQTRLVADHPVFIPCIVYSHQGRQSVLSVMEGYAFVGSDVESSFYPLIRSNPNIRRTLSRGSGIRTVAETVPDASVRELRRRLNAMVGDEISEGMNVRVIDGSLIGIVGQVVAVDGNQASVLVEMRSLHAIRDFPRFYLCPVTDE